MEIKKHYLLTGLNFKSIPLDPFPSTFYVKYNSTKERTMQNLNTEVKRSLMESIKEKFESKEAWEKLTVIFLFKETKRILRRMGFTSLKVEARDLPTGYAHISVFLSGNEKVNFDMNYQELIY